MKEHLVIQFSTTFLVIKDKVFKMDFSNDKDLDSHLVDLGKLINQDEYTEYITVPINNYS